MSAIGVLLDLADAPASDVPGKTREMARLSLYDWMVCGLAAVDEPVARGVRKLVDGEGGKAVAQVMGGGRAPARAAALANGATSHALDYDDTHFAHIGHLSVGICPAALAVGEQEGSSARDVVDAFLLGAEAAIRVGLLLGRAHYDRGFHQTATAGAFGATVAAGRLLGLDRGEMRNALGLCATRASGIKSQFGTMGKPLNAGLSASNGVECAALARAGLTSADDGLEGPQGFVPTHTDDPRPDTPGRGTYLFDDVKYKLHACCHGTHAMIEALGKAAAQAGIDSGGVAAVEIRTHPRWLDVCDVKRPRTGLEAKFSYAWIAGMVLNGRETADDRTFDDACVDDDALAGFSGKVRVAGDAALTDMQVAGRIVTTDGRELPLRHDLAERVSADALAAALRRKAGAVLDPEGARRLWQGVSDIGDMSARGLGRLIAER